MPRVLSLPAVPLRALAISSMALMAALGASILWPEVLLNQESLASVLALIPAFLLAYYRSWAGVSILLAIGMVTLTALHLCSLYFGVSFGSSPIILFLVAPYVAIALGAGWFGELRQSAAELRATQLQLIQSEKLESMGRLAAGVAHEVKNPLMTLLTGVKFLTKRLTDADEPTRQLLQDMVDAVGRADAIIGGLLNYSRQHELSATLVDLNATIEHSLLLVKHELDQRRITVAREFDLSLSRLTLDEFKIQQVFIDLFTNALQAMGQNGILTIRTFRTTLARSTHVGDRRFDRREVRETVAVVQIEDTGPGIPPALLDKVFDPFFTTKPTGFGTGLGLSVSRQIVEMHGGTIAIGNREVGGARVTMTFTLPENGAA